jgi:hypothetical protein
MHEAGGSNNHAPSHRQLESGRQPPAPLGKKIRVIYWPMRTPREQLDSRLVQNAKLVQRLCEKHEKCVKACIPLLVLRPLGTQT